MTNFDYLKKEPKFDTFSDVAIVAEKILYIDPTSCILNCRRAMDFAIKWMYSVDDSLHMPYQNNLISLMRAEKFQDIIGEDLMKRMDFIRKMGNSATHSGKRIREDQAILCLENLQIFFDFVCYCYADKYEEHTYDKDLLTKEEPSPQRSIVHEVDLETLIAENASLKKELTARREAQAETYVPKPLELTEYETRKLYIDAMLLDAGWIKNILFLADRMSLVTQAKRAFVNHYPSLSVTNLCEEKDNYHAHCVFSTYQTMMNCIDSVKEENQKLFTSGHFDLVI